MVDDATFSTGTCVTQGLQSGLLTTVATHQGHGHDNKFSLGLPQDYTFVHYKQGPGHMHIVCSYLDHYHMYRYT